MKRGEIWTGAGPEYVTKPRPVLIIQGDQFDQTGSVIVIPFTGTDIGVSLFRLGVEPDESNGLDRPSWLMIDKITATPRTKLRQRLGRISPDELRQVTPMITLFLGLGVG